MRLSPHPIAHLPPANLWVWLRQSLEKTAPMGGNSSENPNLAGSTGFEPAISSVTGRHVRPLHHEPLFGDELAFKSLVLTRPYYQNRGEKTSIALKRGVLVMIMLCQKDI